MLLIEGAYLVRQDSPLRANEEVDRAGLREPWARAAPMTCHLTRELKAAEIVRADLARRGRHLPGTKLDVAAGVRQQLEADAARHAGLRLGRFMVIRAAPWAAPRAIRPGPAPPG